mgnify:CR=1 FL=1
MGAAFSLFVIAVGAILRYAITNDRWSNVDIEMIGSILMVTGIVGLLISLVKLYLDSSQRGGGGGGAPPAAG